MNLPKFKFVKVACRPIETKRTPDVIERGFGNFSVVPQVMPQMVALLAVVL